MSYGVKQVKRIIRKIRWAFRGEEFLCDSCRYDYGDACRRPERPNATECDDYRRR